jgi:hypothetical protein
MTVPIEDQLPYLHIDDLSFHLPAQTDLAKLNQDLAAAASRGKTMTVRVVDAGGNPVQALVSPARARIIAASKKLIIVPFKGIPQR